MSIQFKIGADPEFFLKNKYGSYKSAVGLIGGSKENPKQLDNEGSAILEDNVAVEFNIKPAETYDQFRSHIYKVLDHLRSILPGYEFSKESAVSFPKEELDTPEAQMFGCEPDFDAWRLCENRKPNAEDANLRSAGGHIHIGSDIATANPVEVIRAMDLHAGVNSIALDVNGKPRRNLYGKAGAFRFKPYGVEYRTLSNFWIFSDHYIQWAFEQTQKALEFVKEGKKIEEDHAFLVQRCINTSNMDDYKFLKQYYGV